MNRKLTSEEKRILSEMGAAVDDLFDSLEDLKQDDFLSSIISLSRNISETLRDMSTQFTLSNKDISKLHTHMETAHTQRKLSMAQIQRKLVFSYSDAKKFAESSEEIFDFIEEIILHNDKEPDKKRTKVSGTKLTLVNVGNFTDTELFIVKQVAKDAYMAIKSVSAKAANVLDIDILVMKKLQLFEGSVGGYSAKDKLDTSRLKDSHVGAYYAVKQKHILMYLESNNKLPTNIDATLVHEMGHHIDISKKMVDTHQLMVEYKDALHNGTYPSTYSKTSYTEFFAECLAYATLGRATEKVKENSLAVVNAVLK